MKQLLQQYSAYNLWANKLMIQSASQLNAQQHTQEVVSSFPSVLGTFRHMMETESAWWQRLKLAEQVSLPSAETVMSFEEVSKKLIETSGNWEEWVRHANDNAISHVFEYRNSKKELFKQPVYEVILHLVNHQSYHRGQLVTLFRQVGLSKMPSTDFVVFCRKNK